MKRSEYAGRGRSGPCRLHHRARLRSRGLHAECVTGRSACLADPERSGALQIALLDEIQRAGVDERFVVVIMPPAERDSATWRREHADSLLERPTEEDDDITI